MNKLWAFGDSYTAGIKPDANHYPPYVKYIEYLGIDNTDLPKEWVELLAEKLEFEYEIVAIGGASNTETFHNFAKNAHRYQKGDIVIINWSLMHRFRWGGNGDIEDENWVRLSQFAEFDERTRKYGSDELFKKIGYNRTLPVWRNEIYYFENLIISFSKSLGFHVFFWEMDNNIHFTLPIKDISKKEYILHEDTIDYIKNNDISEKVKVDNLFWEVLKKYGIKTLYEETNGIVGDPFHLGFNSHKILADLFYQYIKKNT